jgi:hypothetical protein
MYWYIIPVSSLNNQHLKEGARNDRLEVKILCLIIAIILAE